MDAIEVVGKSLREINPITYENLAGLFEAADQHWGWFSQYWYVPSQAGPLRFSFEFGDLDDRNERQAIRELLEEIKHIELVSIILRFIRSDQYGILSPPVERVLNVGWGSDAVETYVNYLRDLRAIRREVGFPKVADADMALWVLHAKCFGGESGNHQLRR
jgi:hypothetical protein